MALKSTRIKIQLLLLTVVVLSTLQIKAQDYRSNMRETDSLIVNSSKMQLEMMSMEEQIENLESSISSYQRNIGKLKGQMDELKQRSSEDELAYMQLEDLANQILYSNDSLRIANADLRRMTDQIQSEKESVEVAAVTLRDILGKERERSQKRMTSFKKNYSRSCTQVTHSTRKGTVTLDDDNVHRLNWIDDFKITVSTCYAIPREEASNNVKVYFYLYRADDFAKAFPIESALPVILAPNTEHSDPSVIYYEGALTLSLPQVPRKQLKTKFVYEIAYQEDIVAGGSFHLN